MPRPKSPDPKRAVTLRIKASTLARYEALGEDWRLRMEAAVERFGLPVEALAPAIRRPEPEKLRRPPVPYGSRLKKR